MPPNPEQHLLGPMLIHNQLQARIHAKMRKGKNKKHAKIAKTGKPNAKTKNAKKPKNASSSRIVGQKTRVVAKEKLHII